MAWGATTRLPSPQMRVLGTQLPRAQTIHERVYGPPPRGRPVVIPPRDLKLQKDKSRPQNYRLLWQKMKPPPLAVAEGLMRPFMPAAITPTVMRVTQAKANRLAR